MSVNMLGLRLTRDVQKRWKNGSPHQRTTGVARANSNQSIGPIAMINSGAVSARLTQKRRVMSRSSGFSSPAAVTVRGSRAMPQIGQEPGSERTISGCIGQVYSVRAEATGVSASRAIPQDGQGPGFG